MRDILPRSKKILLYKSITFSIINYGIELYGRKEDIWFKQLQKTQNRMLKILFKKPILYRTNQMHRDSDILKIEDNRKLRLLLICHKFIYNNEETNVAHSKMQRNNRGR